MTALVAERRGEYVARQDDGHPAVSAAVSAIDPSVVVPVHHPSSTIHRRAGHGERPQETRPHLTEAQLTALWRGQRFPQGALVTRQGVPVRVIFPGRAGRGAGPDFRGALIAGPSGVPLRGDVELHVRSSMFRAHGHEDDRAYSNIVLHVVFEDDTGEDTPLPGGGCAPVVALAPWVATRARELEGWLTRPVLWREPCHDAVARTGAAGVAAALDAEGDRRFDAKVARMADAVQSGGLEQALCEGLLEALGYGGNAPQMAALARLLRWDRLRDAIDAAGQGEGQILAEALLLGSAGLLPARRGYCAPEGECVDPYIERAETMFRASGLPSLDAATWKLWGVRPENFPARRIAGAAALLMRLRSPLTLLTIVDAKDVREAIAPLCINAGGYWRSHYDVCAAPCRLPPAFIGRSRALEIIINVVLPGACAAGDAAMAAAARALYARLPRPAAYGATRFIEDALASSGARVPVNARRAQGLLELQRNWCTQGGCGRCGLSR